MTTHASLKVEPTPAPEKKQPLTKAKPTIATPSFKKGDPQSKNEPLLTPQALTELKDKLKKKYFLLRDEDLPEINRVDLITHVCSKLGMTKLDLEWVIKDL